MTPEDRQTRRRTAAAAADALAARTGDLSRLPALVGFDGFIDDILDAVRTRRSMTPDDYEPIATIPEFADRCRAAAGLSTNIELVKRESRFGGNGPLLATGLATLGLPTDFIGCVGQVDEPTQLHPIYEPLAARCRRVIPLAPPGHTDALEFSDGKIMFNQTAPVQAATWDAIERTAGAERFIAMLADAAVLGMVNWSLCGGVESIWAALIERVLPALPPHPLVEHRRVFIDLSDPAKRTDNDIRRALGMLSRMNALIPVTLGLNLAEAARVARVVGLSITCQPGPSLAAAAAALRTDTGLNTVVIHPREGAAAATAGVPTMHEGGASGAASDPGEHAAWFTGPLVRTPRLSTGAGDMFNAAFVLAQTLGLPLDLCLAVATATSGCYVRDAAAASMGRVIELLRDLPDPE